MHSTLSLTDTLRRDLSLSLTDPERSHSDLCLSGRRLSAAILRESNDMGTHREPDSLLSLAHVGPDSSDGSQASAG